MHLPTVSGLSGTGVHRYDLMPEPGDVIVAVDRVKFTHTDPVALFNEVCASVPVCPCVRFEFVRVCACVCVCSCGGRAGLLITFVWAVSTCLMKGQRFKCRLCIVTTPRLPLWLRLWRRLRGREWAWRGWMCVPMCPNCGTASSHCC